MTQQSVIQEVSAKTQETGAQNMARLAVAEHEQTEFYCSVLVKHYSSVDSKMKHVELPVTEK